MSDEIRSMEEVTPLPGWQRLAWMGAIWACGVAIMAIVAISVSDLIGL